MHKGSQRTQRAQRIIEYHRAMPKPYPTIPFPNHTLYSREDSRPLVTAYSTIMIVVYYAMVSALYPRVVISSSISDYRNLLWPFSHFHWCMAQRSLHAIDKGLLHEYVMLCYRFRSKGPCLQCQGFPSKGPSCTMWFRHFTKYVTCMTQ
jgi:hypothetical protein